MNRLVKKPATPKTELSPATSLLKTSPGSFHTPPRSWRRAIWTALCLGCASSSSCPGRCWNVLTDTMRPQLCAVTGNILHAAWQQRNASGRAAAIWRKLHGRSHRANIVGSPGRALRQQLGSLLDLTDQHSLPVAVHDQSRMFRSARSRRSASGYYWKTTDL